MQIISFSQTKDKVLSDKKTVTRRSWKISYAQQFSAGDYFQIYDKSPRNGGKRVGYGRIKSIVREPVALIYNGYYGDEEAKKEGFDSIKELGDVIENMGMKKEDWCWRIEFEVVTLECFICGNNSDDPDGLKFYDVADEKICSLCWIGSSDPASMVRRIKANQNQESLFEEENNDE